MLAAMSVKCISRMEVFETVPYNYRSSVSSRDRMSGCSTRIGEQIENLEKNDSIRAFTILR